MEEAFKKLQKLEKNDVENLIKWMKESNILDEAKTVEEKARTLLSAAAGQYGVELDKFKEALHKLAKEQKINIEDWKSSLAEHGPKILDAARVGASAFKDAMNK